MPTALLAQPAILPPLTFRLPRPGEADPFYGFSRTFYYELEKRGEIRLIRIKDRGKKTGITLVPHQAVRDLLEREAAKS
jgi:hypothetical protein